MKERNRPAVRAIRSLLAAIDNAEAVPIQQTFDSGAHVAHAAVGAGAGDQPRRELTGADLAQIVEREARERASAQDEYLRAGREDEAQELAEELKIVSAYLHR